MKKILVIEDIVLVRKNISQVLKRVDYQVFEAKNGAAGIKIAQDELPDLIVSNINMPDLSGFEVMVILRKNPATSYIPFIFLSSIEYDEYLKVNEGVNYTHFMAKPFMETELIKKVKEVFLGLAENCHMAS